MKKPDPNIHPTRDRIYKHNDTPYKIYLDCGIDSYYARSSLISDSMSSEALQSYYHTTVIIPKDCTSKHLQTIANACTETAVELDKLEMTWRNNPHTGERKIIFHPKLLKEDSRFDAGAIANELEKATTRLENALKGAGYEDVTQQVRLEANAKTGLFPHRSL